MHLVISNMLICKCWQHKLKLHWLGILPPPPQKKKIVFNRQVSLCKNTCRTIQLQFASFIYKLRFIHVVCLIQQLLKLHVQVFVQVLVNNWNKIKQNKTNKQIWQTFGSADVHCFAVSYASWVLCSLLRAWVLRINNLPRLLLVGDRANNLLMSSRAFSFWSCEIKTVDLRTEVKGRLQENSRWNRISFRQFTYAELQMT